MGIRDMPCGKFFRRIRRSIKSQKRSTNKFSADENNDIKGGTGQTGETARESNETFHIERLPIPTKSSTDRNQYSVIRLSNGVVATIIAEGQEKEKKVIQPKELNLNELRQLRSGSFTKLGKEMRQLRSDTSFGTSKIKPEISGTSLFSPNKEQDLERSFRLETKHTLAACAVTVDVGSFSDPENIAGLSHLLEHVLSMGTDKFEGEDEFEAFLGQSGGSYDAETETEYMSFYFECQDTFIYPAMEMFSRFFVAPLMKWDSIRRERFAVASEFAEQLYSDNARRMQIICMTANSNNPAKKFTWGNLETLKNKIGEDELLSSLKEFRDAHFTADRVKVAVQAKLPAETLEGWVNILFSEIPKKSVKPARLSRPLETPFNKGKFCRFYKVQSVGDICEININWALPPMDKKYKCKPLEYISYVIGAEGEGSLISYLRQKHMALYLTSEVEEGGLVSNSLYTIFTVCVSLTEEGRQNVENVIKYVFGYLKMLKNKGPSESTWLELQEIADIGFKYNRIRRPAENVRLVSQGMIQFPPKDYLTGWTKFFEFNGEEIQNYLAAMTPSNANILLHAKDHGEKLDHEEKWFKTKYKVSDIPSSWINEWNAVEPDVSFSLPPSNAYIADDFGLVDRENKDGFPKMVADTKLYKIWHKGDEYFNVPYATINVLLGTTQDQQTVENTVRQMLFAKMFVYQMIDELYFAQVAHIEHKMTSTEYGLEISIHGLSQNIPKVLREVAHGLVDFKDKAETQQHMLKYLKTVLERNVMNALSNGASFLEDIRKSIFSSLTFAGGEKYPHIRSLTIEDMDEYWHEMLANVRVVALIQGNISANKAKVMIEEFVYILKATCADNVRAQPSARVIPLGESIVCLSAFHPQEGNCYTQSYYQLGQGGIMECMALQLFVATMSEPLFDELRTKEQLGYSVSAIVSEILGVLGVIISINSQMSRHSTEFIRNRIDTFVDEYLKYFRVMSRVEFDEVKKTFLTMKKMKPGTLKEESGRNWWEIRNGGTIDRTTKEIEAISRLDKKWTTKVVDRTMDSSKSNNTVRKLMLQVVGFKTDTEGENETSTIADGLVVYKNADTEANSQFSIIVKDVLEWKNSLPTY